MQQVSGRDEQDRLAPIECRMAGSPVPEVRRSFVIAVAVATVLAVWLRSYGITSQVVIDDEWHAIHKLASSSYGGIFTSFGWADHSIPLTLLYKAMADTVGLAEGRLRALQIVCGFAFVPFAAWLAWRATRDAPCAALFAFLVAGAPFLVMWSRFARPYAITLLLTVVCIAALWRWRTRRTAKLAACIALTAALSAWLHPISGVYAALGCLFVFIEDACAPDIIRPRPTWRSLQLGAAVAGAMVLLLAEPLYHDRSNLTGKAGGDQPDFGSFERALAIIWGGLPTPAVVLATMIAAWGAVAMFRRDPRLTAYLAVLGLVPGAMLTLTGAMWLREGQNFLRYQLPLLPLVLFFGSVGVMSLVRLAARDKGEVAAWIAAAILSTAYLVATPAIAQVAMLGIWYGHLDYHWDYRNRWNEGKRRDPGYDPPDFYRKLARMAPGSAPIIEAPFSHEAPSNPFAFWATFHRQPETLGMIHDLCLEGERVGEPARDRRFRFRDFVFLDDVPAVRKTGARYLIVAREFLHGRPFRESQRCIEELVTLYGAPMEVDARAAVFDLRPTEPPPKPQ